MASSAIDDSSGRQNTIGAAGMVPGACPWFVNRAPTLASHWRGHRHPLAGSRRGHQHRRVARGLALGRECEFIEEMAGVATATASQGAAAAEPRTSCWWKTEEQARRGSLLIASALDGQRGFPSGANVTTFMRDPPGGDAHKALEE